MRSPVRHAPAAVLVLALALTPAPAFGQGERLLTLQDVSPDLARLLGNTPLDFVAAARITYGHTGQSNYDEFFRNSAISFGGFHVGQRLTDNATLNLKKYARSKAAVASLQEEIATLTQGADTSQWTTEQSIAVLQAAKKKDQLTGEERSYMLATAVNLAATIPVVEASASASTQLTSTAPGLVSGARSAFGLVKAGGVARSVRQSADRLSTIPTQAPKLVESMTVLTRGLAMINDN
jgi:hypothetical protein